MAGFQNVLVGWCRAMLFLAVAAGATAAGAAEPTLIGAEAKAALEKIGEKIGPLKDVCVVLGLPQADKPEFVVDLARGSDLLVYFQSARSEEVAAVRETALAAGLLGTRVFVDEGDCESIHVADNLAGAVLVAPSVRDAVTEQELLRALRPEGKAIVGDRQIVKSFPQGADDWSHPYHGPDNNPQSTDQLARWPYLTQFLGNPKFCPMPEVSVAAGGRVFRAFGHIAHKANQNAMLNTLICANGYNGLVLWKRDLKEGFMIHRNTMIATPETLYLADDESCKLIDARTGRVKDEIVVPDGIADGPVWKWMALEDGVLYALLGGKEVPIFTERSQTPGLGHWPWGMWAGHDYKDPKSSFGFGRTFVAIDPGTKKILWTYRDDEYLDSRGVCMKGGRIYFHCPEKFLGCLDAGRGDVAWKTSEAELLRAIGPNGRAQHYVTGYATTSYAKCNDQMIFFAGPQRSRLVAASAQDGKLLWHKEHGNLQLVLRDDGFYAAGPGATGHKLAYDTGEVLAQLPRRRACTRATGSIDSIFYRTPGGTVRIDVASNTAQHIAPMRPPCQDGVIISDGHLYWGPWMCGCQLSLYGHICLAPVGELNLRPGLDDSRFEPGQGDMETVEPLEVSPGDWPSYCGDSHRSGTTKVNVPRQVVRSSTFQPAAASLPTAPVAAGGLVFVGDRRGVVRAIGSDGKLRWKSFTGGAIFFPPEVYQGRVFVGSADGRVYAFEAASGRRLWSFRVAPAQRRICAYGKLISTWPVAGGVVVHDGVVYAAAGIAHYDGTHVVALDPLSGKVKWYNDASGTLSEAVHGGISLQGSLYVRGDRLCFAGGGVYDTAQYDLQTGKCLNEPRHVVNSDFQTAFYAYYPEYSKYLSLSHTFPDGRTLRYDAAYEGSRHSRLALLASPAAGAANPGERDRKAVWSEKFGRRFNSLIVADKVLLAAGESGAGNTVSYFLAAVNLEDGADVWYQELPVGVVKGGAAIDRDGRIFAALTDGRVVGFSGTR